MNTVRVLISLCVATVIITSLIGVVGYKYKEKPGEAEEVQVDVVALVKSNCISCHGADLKGSSFAPTLIGTKLDKAGIVEILKNGKNGMPKGLVPGNEEIVADYILAGGVVPEPATKEESKADSAEADTAEIEGIVKASCAGCHGSDLKGGMAPTLAGTALSKEEIVDILKNGKGGMPKGLVPGKEESVADYILSLSKGE